jgi:rhodanese-related sulfurtransferase
MERILEFAGNNLLLVGGLIVSVVALIVYELRHKASGLIDIDATDAIKLINNDAVVIDLRSADAFGRGHIVNARNIPSDELDAKVSTLESLKSKPIVAVCDAGMSSRRTVNALRAKGLESVYSLKGGMTGWTQAGLPVVTGKKTKSKSDKGKQGKGKKRG